MLDRLARELAALRAGDQFRDLKTPSGIQLGSNDYLGLSTHPRLKAAILRALQDDARVSSTGSRLLSGNHERWERVEAHFAEFAGAEASLFFSSGYLANIGLLSSVLNPADTVFSDASNHASLIDGIRLSRARKVIFPHLDVTFLEDALRAPVPRGAAKVVVVESVFSMEGDRAPLEELMAICERSDAMLIVDAAHSTAVDPPIRRSDCLLATVHTCGKALASAGAFVAGSGVLQDLLVNRARTFVFSTALPVYCAAQIEEALVLAGGADAARAKLAELGRHFRGRMKDAGFDIGQSDSQIVPLYLGSNETALRFAASLTAAGFAIRAVRPPTVPAGSSRLRFSLNASLSVEDLDRAVDVLAAIPEVVR